LQACHRHQGKRNAKKGKRQQDRKQPPQTFEVPRRPNRAPSPSGVLHQITPPSLRECRSDMAPNCCHLQASEQAPASPQRTAIRRVSRTSHLQQSLLTRQRVQLDKARSDKQGAYEAVKRKRITADCPRLCMSQIGRHCSIASSVTKPDIGERLLRNTRTRGGEAQAHHRSARP